MPLLALRFWYSSVVSHIDPVHTPWAPSASEAATWRPRADAARAEHGYVGPDRVDDLGGQHHAGDLAGVAAGLVALGHDDVHAVLDVRERVLGGAGQGGHLRRPPRGPARSRPPAASRARWRSAPAGASARRRRASGRRSAASRGRPRGPRPRAAGVRRAAAGCARRSVMCSGGDHRLEVDRLALGGDLHRHHDVDAVRLAVGVVVEPGQRLLELLGLVEPDGSRGRRARRRARPRRRRARTG